MKEKERQEIEDYVKSLKWTPKDYYWCHSFQVRELALLIQKRVGGDKEVIEVSALLHDIGKADLLAPGHEKISAQKAEELLIKMEMDKLKIKRICKCIQYEDSGEIETRILRSADSISLLADDSGGRKWYFKKVLGGDKKKIIQEIKKSYSEIEFDFARKMVEKDYRRLLKEYS
jgi:putative nucleotidyltransferase with HDIG domain